MSAPYTRATLWQRIQQFFYSKTSNENAAHGEICLLGFKFRQYSKRQKQQKILQDYCRANKHPLDTPFTDIYIQDCHRQNFIKFCYRYFSTGKVSYISSHLDLLIYLHALHTMGKTQLAHQLLDEYDQLHPLLNIQHMLPATTWTQQEEVLNDCIQRRNPETILRDYCKANNYAPHATLHDLFVEQVKIEEFAAFCQLYFSSRRLCYFPNLELLIYLSTLITMGDTTTASPVLEQYRQIHGTRDIHLFLPVASWAHQQGVADECISLAHQVYQKLRANRDAQLFERMIRGKTVAIVGNGPSALGQNKGAEIDAHDIVIRFNNYRISGFEQDYGSRTSIWVKCTAVDIDHSLRDEDIELIVYESDYEHHPLLTGYLEALAETKCPSTYLGFEEHASLRSELQIFPSTGLVLVNKVAQCESRSFNCYGFNFQKESPDDYATHYFQDRDEDTARQKSMHHSFLLEGHYLKQLLDKNP